MIPFFNLGGPCITSNTKWCDYQNAVCLKAVKQKIQKGRQCDRRLAKAHIQQDRRNRVCFDIVGSILLIIMWNIFHQGFLQSGSRHPARRRESQAAAAIGVSLPAKGAVPCREP